MENEIAWLAGSLSKSFMEDCGSQIDGCHLPLSPQFCGSLIPDNSCDGSVVLNHLPLSPELMLSEGSPMQRHTWTCSPFLSCALELTRPQRQEAVSMNSGILVGEAHFPFERQGLLV